MSAPSAGKPRALVLGGGGVIGVAWEAGLVHELRAAGFDPEAFEIVVGTSAGAIVGAPFAAGRHAREPGTESPPAPAEPGETPRRPSLPPSSELDIAAIGAIFRSWAALEYTTPEAAAQIGAHARTLYRDYEASMVATVGGPDVDWPERRLLIAAVDTQTGQRRVFDRASGVPLQRAIAASASVPGLFPSVEIDGVLYMDGQVHSSTNADLLEPLAPLQVVIAAPTNADTGGGIGPHAARALARERAALEARGCEVLLATPSAEDAKQFGKNLMDPTKRGIAHALGQAAGRALAERLRS